MKLEQIMKIYSGINGDAGIKADNMAIFLHNLPTVKNYCLHIHVMTKELYRRFEGDKG